jgi:hypothetical protein
MRDLAAAWTGKERTGHIASVRNQFVNTPNGKELDVGLEELQGGRWYVSESRTRGHMAHRVLSSARIASFNSSNGASSFLSTRSNCTLSKPRVSRAHDERHTSLIKRKK